MKVGRKIYFDVATGEVILDTGDRQDSVYETTIEQDVSVFKILSERNRETFDVLELPYGLYSQDFTESNGYRVNVETKELEFSYPDPNEPEAVHVFVKSLSEEVSTLKENNEELSNYMLDVDMRVVMIELGL